MENITTKTYLSLIDCFRNQKILVIGDLILDVYFSGDCTRISPEAPVPVVDVNEKKYCLGGAGNVVANLKALGCEVMFCAVSGQDEGRDAALRLLKENGVATDNIIADPDRRTLIKTRVTTGKQCLVRIDEGSCDSISGTQEDELIHRIESLYARADALLIADYDKGVLSDRVITAIENLLSGKRKFVAVDSKKPGAYRSLRPSLIKPNYPEFLKLIGQKGVAGDRVKQVKSFGRVLYDRCGAEITAVTLDKDGVVIFSGEEFCFHEEAPHVEFPHVSGAGDSFISSLLLSILAKGSLEQSVSIALESARIAIEKEDTSFCSREELKRVWATPAKAPERTASLPEVCTYYREQGKRIVFTNGCFDILHRGHIEYLNQARQLGDVLIVGINTDESIKRLKGPERPINNLLDRMEVLAALGCVDHVYSFGEKHNDTPIELIKLIKPDVFVKGGDYKGKDIPELKILKEAGAEIQFLPFVKNLSTTDIISRINHGSNLKVSKTG
jgi:D-beta-D-heptose 7-phosphate kinase/D-beta-D-heptose 1-phosphate adenosyltransferase